PFLLPFALIALLVIFEIGLGPLQQRQELIALFRPGAELLQVLDDDGGRVLGGFGRHGLRGCFVRFIHRFSSSARGRGQSTPASVQIGCCGLRQVGASFDPDGAVKKSRSFSKKLFRCGETLLCSSSASSRNNSSCRLVRLRGVSTITCTSRSPGR